MLALSLTCKAEAWATSLRISRAEYGFATMPTGALWGMGRVSAVSDNRVGSMN
jgi:hypothetical protein